MNDIIEIIEDLKEIREAVNLNDSVHIAIDQKIEKYQKTLEEHLDKKILPISSVSGRNIEQLKRLMLKTKDIDKEQQE